MRKLDELYAEYTRLEEDTLDYLFELFDKYDQLLCELQGKHHIHLSTNQWVVNKEKALYLYWSERDGLKLTYSFVEDNPRDYELVPWKLNLEDMLLVADFLEKTFPNLLSHGLKGRNARNLLCTELKTMLGITLG